MNESIVKAGQHVVLWILFFLAPLLFLPGFIDLIDLKGCYLTYYITLSSFLIVLFYSNAFILIPQLYSRGRFILFGFIQVIYVIFTFLVVFMLGIWIIGPCDSLGVIDASPMFKVSRVILPRHIFVLAMSFLYFYRRRIKSIHAEHSKAQLRLLKQQIKPHTLFNMLNTIYGQAVTQSEYTAESIAKLSDMMRYALNDSNNQFVPLEQEVEYLKSYVSFEKLRLTDKTDVSLIVEGEIGAQLIAPLLLVPLVENAFKYGVSNEVETEITMVLKIDASGIRFEVINDMPQVKMEVQKSHQIGLKNLKTRLELLYPNRYDLSIQDDSQKHKVLLKLRKS